MNEEVITVDYRRFSLRQSGYKYSLETPPDIDRGLGAVTYRAKVLQFEEHVRIDRDFPWSSDDKTLFELAGPLHLIAFSQTSWQLHFEWIFAIGWPRQHSQGLLVGCLGGRDIAGDAYLPSWVVGPPDPRRMLKEESKGFPPGVGFLVVSRQ
jgi:hypothetical protein